MIDLKWRYAFALFFNLYLICFLFFGIMWWIIAYNHGDFQHVNDPLWEPCVSTMYSFPKCLLFSIETQTTIGYGVSYPNTDCDGTLFMVYMQITIGIMLDNLLLGFMFVKFAQPKKRQKTILFSKNACITHHEGELAIQIRVGDLRKSHLLAAQVHGVLVRRHVSNEGVSYPLYMNKVDFRADDMDNGTVVLMWPMILTHKITEDSPFYDIKPADLTNEKYELIVFIEGTIETTGEFCQVRTSYTPREFLWGHRFDRIEEFDSGNGRWEIDFAAFNDVVYTNNIRHSSRELNSFRRKKKVPASDTKEETSEKVAPIQTKNLHTISYVGPELPPRGYDKGGLNFGIRGNEIEASPYDDDSDDTVIDNKMRRADSVVSFETAAGDSASLRDEDEYRAKSMW